LKQYIFSDLERRIIRNFLETGRQPKRRLLIGYLMGRIRLEPLAGDVELFLELRRRRLGKSERAGSA